MELWQWILVVAVVFILFVVGFLILVLEVIGRMLAEEEKKARLEEEGRQ